MDSIKLIAFDLDGTLLDSVPDLAWAADKAVQSLGFPAVQEVQVRDWVGNGADVLIARSLSQSITPDPQLSDELKQKARTLFDDFYHQSGHALSHLYPKVVETLNALHQAGFTLALVTNKPSKFVPDILAHHGIEHLFVDVLGGDCFEEKKPNPMALNWLLEKHQLEPSQMLMVGDSKNDILAAKNAGCHSFGLTYGYNHGEPISDSAPDYVADCVAELLELK
ncbi:phosphoglycolate phosphatase [Vibrio sp. SCSIO 43136]|uniref:phosphoglycolate phosphatase n=1 Tax=Vibrio sp. SCSIO 43136 TaxID=2819101 RepID=UPI002076065E|nr:phosphoglycolate phosphatase [Vibrio sp. SCSIO 43136]USD66607.1 phosphoglycolate phosphatase [Vibrio sp. SCSIO 43136]